MCTRSKISCEHFVSSFFIEKKIFNMLSVWDQKELFNFSNSSQCDGWTSVGGRLCFQDLLFQTQCGGLTTTVMASWLLHNFLDFFLVELLLATLTLFYGYYDIFICIDFTLISIGSWTILLHMLLGFITTRNHHRHCNPLFFLILFYFVDGTIWDYFNLAVFVFFVCFCCVLAQFQESRKMYLLGLWFVILICFGFPHIKMTL